ncbi:MAG: peroxiredoxin-like family protein [Rubricoccaceae bacterium]|nr:peroxiredoxin-like family protein [Rubricoccaceae bacterium]
MKRKAEGERIERRTLETIRGGEVAIPDAALLTHLQFRRYAGCPMCNLHLQSFIKRHSELVQHGIQEVVVFHSSKQALLNEHADAPFALIPDPKRTLYKEFGVEVSWGAVLHPRVWITGVSGLLRHGLSIPERRESTLGLPADFLIGADGRVLACKYGMHASDHWEVDDVLNLASKHTNEPV